MEIKKEKLSWIENVARKNAQIQADLDVIVPDTKPDIKRILQVDANADITTCEMQNDRVLLCGNVYFNVIYLPEENDVLQSIRVTVPFTDVVSINGINSEMECNIDAEIMSVNYKIINGRKFSVKSMVEATIDIKNIMSVELVTGFSDGNAQVQNSEIKFLKRNAKCNKRIEINEKISVPDTQPAISEVLNTAAKMNEYSVKLINNKAIVKGNINLICTYVDAVNKNINTIKSEPSFTEIFDVEGVSAEDLCNIAIDVKKCEYNCEEDFNGEVRGIEIVSCLEVDISAFKENRCIAVNDCYAIDKSLELVTSEINIPRRVSDVAYSDTLKTSLNINENEPIIEKVYDVYSKAYIDDITVKQEKIFIKGVVDNYVLYISKDENAPIYCIKKEIEFNQGFACEGCTKPQGDFLPEVLNTSYVLSADNVVDLRINLRISGVIYDITKENVITDIKETGLKSQIENASITVYFVQDNETLWDIAKKYFTTIDAIANVNELEEMEVKKGMRLLIPKYKSV